MFTIGPIPMRSNVLVLTAVGGYVFVAYVLLWMAMAALCTWIVLGRGIGSSESLGKLRQPGWSEPTVQQRLESIR